MLITKTEKVEKDFNQAYADVDHYTGDGPETGERLPHQLLTTKELETRKLQWRALHAVTPAEAVRIVTFDYNDVGEQQTLMFLAGHSLSDVLGVTLAREYSFCIYVKVWDNGSMGSLAVAAATESLLKELRANESVTADEIDLNAMMGEIRLWWD